MARTSTMGRVIYQLKVTLQELERPIWRRIRVPGEYSLQQLHDVLQAVMGWENAHSYQFVAGATYYGDPDPEGEELALRRASRTRLRTVAQRLGSTLFYEYDFGDGWRHEVLLEGLLLPEEGVHYPYCLAGARACPPEDCGGVSGYAELVAILRDPTHEEYAERWKWLGGAFDPEGFDLAAANAALRALQALPVTLGEPLTIQLDPALLAELRARSKVQGMGPALLARQWVLAQLH